MLLGRIARLATVIATVALPVLRPGAVLAEPAAQSARELQVLVGAGQDTVGVDAYLPHTVRVRAGDTVTWKVNSDEPHTVSFSQGFSGANAIQNPFLPAGDAIPQNAINVPGPDGGPPVNILNPVALFPTRLEGDPVEVYSGSGFASSGRLQRAPLVPGQVNQAFSLTFDTPGTYAYLCLIHTFSMQGIVEVTAATAEDVPEQAEIDAAARGELDILSGRIDRARGQGQSARTEPGPNGTTTWYVRAGNTQFGIDDNSIQLREFLPRDISIKVGDNVVWGTSTAHVVTFIPAPPPPLWLTPQQQPDGTWRVVRNPTILTITKPGGVFEPTKIYNSGVMGAANPAGTSWVLTFDKPGTFEYFCGIHRELGMKGSITVVSR